MNHPPAPRSSRPVRLSALAAGVLLGSAPGLSASPVDASMPTPTPAPRPAVAAPAAVAAVGPRMSFDRIEHDYGTLWEGESRTTTFRFRNDGDQPLVIRTIKPSCGCTTTDLERMTFAPGEGDEITVNFDAKGHGAQRKTITVLTNAGPPQQLVITSLVKQFLAADPSTLRIGDLQMGRTLTRRVRFTSADPSFTPEGVTVRGRATRFVRARIVSGDEAAGSGAGRAAAGPQLPGAARSANANEDVNAATTPPGPGEFDVLVSVGPGAPWGALFANVQVWGMGERPGDAAGRTRHTHELTVSGRVFGEVMASDTMIRVSRVPAGKPFRRVVTFRSRSGEPLALQSAQLLAPSLDSMTATLTPEPGTEGRRWQLVVEADPGTTTGRVSGSVVVTTGVPGEERLTFLVAGMIAPPGG
jgi:hypothetical protein